MKDKSMNEIEREEQEFYGHEDYELEQRRAEYEEHMRDIEYEDRDVQKIGSDTDRFLGKYIEE